MTLIKLLAFVVLGVLVGYWFRSWRLFAPNKASEVGAGGIGYHPIGGGAAPSDPQDHKLQPSVIADADGAIVRDHKALTGAVPGFHSSVSDGQAASRRRPRKAESLKSKDPVAETGSSAGTKRVARPKQTKPEPGQRSGRGGGRRKPTVN
jgi:hypothetical protein